VAFIQLRRTVARWEQQRALAPAAAARRRFAAGAVTSESKV
jgi:hypothetical protein